MEFEKEKAEALQQETTFMEMENRDAIIVRTSIIGIISNVLLAVFKAVVGILTNSIAIVLDAVNNLSDAASSVITIVGTKLAGKEPDKKHPFGYGRIEYLSAMLIALLVLYAGVTSFTESIKKIIEPTTPNYSSSSLVIVAVAVLVKIVLGRYVKGIGEKVKSDSLINSGEDASLDAVISTSTLVAAILFIWKGWALEAWLGAIIALVIIKSGIEMLRETLSKILGESADPSLTREIKKTVNEFPEVRGAYDLVLNNYGPDRFNGSIHVEIVDSYTVGELDELIRRITHAVYEKHHVLLTAISVYAMNTSNSLYIEMRNKISKRMVENEHVMQVHGFYVNEKTKTIRFDAVISFSATSRKELLQKMKNQVLEMYPDYQVYIAPDIDYSEL